ncbi:MAG TPA: TetR/AcrR family transcriptional regulator [Acidimicrobiales bacterium]|jgi:AcrR family transcriptional regulator
MGHKEDLLAAARRCLVTRGYARTTARDLVAESGTNLASIGYHFGSKDALLAQALGEAFIEYTDKVMALAGTLDPEATDPHQAVSSAWLAMTEMQSDFRPLLVAFVEALAQAERNDPLRVQLAAGYEEMRRRSVEGILAMVPDLPTDIARSIASFFFAVSDGYMVQWLLDPEATPSGADLLEAGRLAMLV